MIYGKSRLLANPTCQFNSLVLSEKGAECAQESLPPQLPSVTVFLAWTVVSDVEGEEEGG